MKRFLAFVFILLLVASVAFGAAGYRHLRVFGNIEPTGTNDSTADSTVTLLAGSAANPLDISEAVKKYDRGVFAVGMQAADADIDSMHFVLMAYDGAGAKTIDTLRGLTATLGVGGGAVKWFRDSTRYSYADKVLGYLIVYGDAAGTAIQTVKIWADVTWWNTLTGETVRHWWRKNNLNCSFQE